TKAGWWAWRRSPASAATSAHRSSGSSDASSRSPRSAPATSTRSQARRSALGDRDPVARDRLAAMLSSGNAYRALALRQGPVASTAGSLMKLGITELMFNVSVLRGDLSGAEAMLAGPDAAGMLAAPGARIAGGTSQVQRNIIGERLL